MKKPPLWTVAIPFIIFFAGLQYVYDSGERGELNSSFLRNHVYDTTRMINGVLTNIKFKMRGAQPPKNKIVIVTADDASIDAFGRWPWKRIVYAKITQLVFKAGAKQMGMDVAFSEAEETVPHDLYELPEIKGKPLEKTLQDYENDPVFASIILKNRERIVLGFSESATCQPGYEGTGPESDPCQYVKNEEINKAVADQLDKFALKQTYPFPKEKLFETPLKNLLTAFSNIPMFREPALHAGSFSIVPDPDGFIRRYPIATFRWDKIYPSLAVAMAELAKEDELKIDFNEGTGLVRKVYFSKTPNEPIPVNPLGNIDINFRGKSNSFEYISARDLVEKFETVADKLKDAHVFFGVSALGIYDMRAFPFDSNVPGVEGHATALDNLLSNDSLRSANNLGIGWLPMILIIVLGLTFSFFFSRWEAIPSLLSVAGFFLAFGLIDLKVLFNNSINFPSAFLLIEIMCIFVVILAIRYILEEQNKKFVREAFSKYLAPQVVDLVLKDPSKLTVGGERRDLTILFSDLRGFTTFSEKMDPKTLSQFLNEYLSEMTEVIFENEGTLDKYIGDAIMAFWGAPLHQKDHAARAWRTAVEMQKRLAKVAPVYKEKYGIEVSTGVGINAGEVSVGNMGSKRIFEYTVIGDHVNLASRLESLTRTYGCDILSTLTTMEQLPEDIRSQYYYRVVDSVIVKGKTLPIEMIEILLEKPDQALIDLFYQAKKEFKNREWDTSIKHFEEVIEMYKKQNGKTDAVSEMYIKRCEAFKLDPPPADWDGTAAMKSK